MRTLTKFSEIQGLSSRVLSFRAALCLVCGILGFAVRTKGERGRDNPLLLSGKVLYNQVPLSQTGTRRLISSRSSANTGLNGIMGNANTRTRPRTPTRRTCHQADSSVRLRRESRDHLEAASGDNAETSWSFEGAL
ncbi:uncharacterized protein SCHCODRAFT_02229153 [Schizophyllum commune H4-8]|uniref:uncharacterized protein n=1 Tax=Schizophyllum commune (strain H4-8 / FGSC 9210) TaxID=578458 RepID=UPI00215E6CFB|nr:uncharacterized protein SCHCODRAFT_02229153 [Schizophyllum commune H4-8]KAI5895345.1 hypothetical protein SCHCODRAFT_02229153 [Schizophyllum commune H4-8]